jgi:hypothetical protein
MFWFSDNGFQKKGKVGRVFIYFFYFQSNMGRVFIFCFYFQRFKNIAQTSSILLFWQTNNTIVFTLSTGRLVHRTICLERNCTLKLVFTRSHAEFLLSFLIDQSFKRLSKLVRVTGTLENLNLAVNLNLFFFFKNMMWKRFVFCTAIKSSYRPKF